MPGGSGFGVACDPPPGTVDCRTRTHGLSDHCQRGAYRREQEAMKQGEKIPSEISPNRYIEKVSLATSEVLDEEVLPRQLLVRYHRDYHVVDVQARRVMSRLMRATNDPEHVRERMREIRRMGHKAAEVIAKAIRQDKDKVARALFGLKEREYYFRYRLNPVSEEEVLRRVSVLQEQAAEKMAAVTGKDGLPRLRVLLTGGTGFVGKEFLWQVSQDPAIAEMVVVIRPKTIRNRKTREVEAVISPEERGEQLLDQLWLESPAQRAKFRFVAGDVEQPNLGIADDEMDELETTLTHVIHCAASVSFDDPYDKSFRANVSGTLNALAFSHRLQNAPASPFVAHIGIETSYIHGRQMKGQAREDDIVFPRNFYNNYYELTKAMASIETERFMLKEGLRVVQLCPAIVIGEARAGNNRGDTKVVNAPVNLFGRAQEIKAQTKDDASWLERSKASMLTRMATIFPGDPSAELNLIPVDWVVRGMIAALKNPRAVGERVHLATDNRVTSEEMVKIVSEELETEVHLAEPTLHRNVTLPLLNRVLARVKQERLASILDKLGTIFGGYSEWGQPIHEVGKDVEILGLPKERPNTPQAFRMLCRHNRYVQDFGKVKDLGEMSRREKVWWDFVRELEDETGGPVGKISADDFRHYLAERIDLETFTRAA